MSHRWYYQMLLEEFGPVTEQQLRQLIDEGTLSSDDLVRPEDSTEWIAVASRGSDLSGDGAGPADIADLSELSFSFEPTGPTERRAAYSESEPPADSSPHATRPHTGHTFQPQEENTEIYYCQSLGQTLGPMSLTELTGMAESGSLSDSDLVRTGASGTWQPAGGIPELSATFMLSDRGTDDAATMSATTQKRLGPAAVASLNAASRQATSIANIVPEMTTTESPVPEPPQAMPAVEAKEMPAIKKVRRRKKQKGEEELLDEIFDDVFADDEEDRNSRHSAPGRPLSAASSAPYVPSASTEPTKPSPPMSASSSTSPSPATLAAAAMVRAAAASHSRSKPTRSVGFSFDGPVKFIAIGILLLSVTGGLIWQFGLPSFSLGSDGTSKYAGRIAVVVTNYKSLGEKPSEGKWQEFCQSTKTEFEFYYKGLAESGASSTKDTACLEGMKSILALTSTKLGDKVAQKELLTKIEQSLATMAK